MKIINAIQLRNPGPVCQDCAFFQNDPLLIEEFFPGIKSMCSGYASVRDRDGICSYNQVYRSARDSCPHFEDRHIKTRADGFI